MTHLLKFAVLLAAGLMLTFAVAKFMEDMQRPSQATQL